MKKLILLGVSLCVFSLVTFNRTNAHFDLQGHNDKNTIKVANIINRSTTGEIQNVDEISIETDEGFSTLEKKLKANGIDNNNINLIVTEIKKHRLSQLEKGTSKLARPNLGTIWVTLTCNYWQSAIVTTYHNGPGTAYFQYEYLFGGVFNTSTGTLPCNSGSCYTIDNIAWSPTSKYIAYIANAPGATNTAKSCY